MFKKLFFLPLIFVFTAFMCESDDALVEEGPAFPEAAAGEIAIASDGAFLVFTETGGAKNSECQLNFGVGWTIPTFPL